jgi:hypothetical protein
MNSFSFYFHLCAVPATHSFASLQNLGRPKDVERNSPSNDPLCATSASANPNPTTAIF